jgi:hypothetical protein
LRKPSRSTRRGSTQGDRKIKPILKRGLRRFTDWLDDQDHAGPECCEVAIVALESGDSGHCGTTVAELTIPRPNAQRFPGARNCCDKNVIVPLSEPGKVNLNAAELSSGKRLKNQIE